MKGIKVTGSWKEIKLIWKSLKKNKEKFKIWKNKNESWSIYF